MNREQIIEMAREAFACNFCALPVSESRIERFFHMAQAAEREACEKICIDHGHMGLAAAIRARGSK